MTKIIFSIDKLVIWINNSFSEYDQFCQSSRQNSPKIEIVMFLVFTFYFKLLSQTECKTSHFSHSCFSFDSPVRLEQAQVDLFPSVTIYHEDHSLSVGSSIQAHLTAMKGGPDNTFKG